MESLVQAVLENCRRTPEKIAVATVQRAITYRELETMILRFAAALKYHGIKRGSRIALEAVDLPSFFAAWLGCHLAGMIAVPIERNISEYKLKEVLRTTKPALVFYKQMGKTYDAFFRETEAYRPHMPKGEMVSSIISTTGTTGNAVLVTHTNRSQAATMENLIYGLGITEETVLFSNVPFDLSAGYRRVFATLCVGATAIITYRSLSEDLLLDLFTQYGVNSVSLLNIDLGFVLNLKNKRLDEEIGGMRFVETVAGAICTGDIRMFRTRFPQTVLYNVYGATESGCLLINNACENPAEHCLGRPTCHARLRLIDENGEEITQAGKYGYISASGEMNMAGYYRKKSLSDRVMGEGFVTIQDIAYFDEQGYYYFVSRVGDIIDVSGHKVVPTEVEAVCMQYEGVRDCAYASENDVLSGKIPVLYFSAEEQLQMEDYLDFLRQQLEEYKVPQRLVRVSEIPRTATGKILRQSLSAAEQMEALPNR